MRDGEVGTTHAGSVGVVDLLELERGAALLSVLSVDTFVSRGARRRQGGAEHVYERSA